MESWYRFLGVRPRETKAVWLFFAHNFLLGIGTILVYVAANVVLLAEHPERNLPLAYCVGAVAMMAVGRLYAYGEHHWLLRKLAVRALLVAAVLTLVLGGLVLLGPSVATAVTIMTGYRLVYLLTNLEFWGMSAVVFNVRQGRRLFSVISSGDMPAKAIGAVLAIFVHINNALYALLFTAAATYLLAFFIQRATFQTQVGAARNAPEPEPQQPRPSLVHQLLGASPLVRAMGLSLMAIAAVAVGVEYLFFVNVKYKLQEQATILQYVGGVLALTYLLAMLFKLAFSRHGLDRLGVRWTLAVLPLMALAGLLLFGGLQLTHAAPGTVMLYFGGLYLVLEVLRRAMFEPVFLVLFQPLAAPERLEGHSLVKGFYEPLGLGLGGVLLWSGHTFPALNQWAPFIWMGVLLLLALFLLQLTYWKYIDELKSALGLRFTSAPPPSGASAGKPAPANPSSKTAVEAIEHLQKAHADTLFRHADLLLKHSDSRVRNRVLGLLGDRADITLLRRLAYDDPDADLRHMASRMASLHPEANDLLNHHDLAVRGGAIRGRLEAAPTDEGALASLAGIAAAPDAKSRLMALALLDLLTPEQQVEVVTSSFQSADQELVQAAVQAAARVASPSLLGQLVALLRHKALHKPASDALQKTGAAALPYLKEAFSQETDGRSLQLVAQICARMGTPAARQVLVDVAQAPNLHARAAALRALSSFEKVPGDMPLFQRLVEEEMRFAQHLLHGMVKGNTELRRALRYELGKTQQRIFGLLIQVYERQPMMDAQRGVAHASGERQANALEILDNLIPRPLYQGLQAMLDVGRLSEKVQAFDDLLGPARMLEPIQTVIIRRGPAAFSAWTIGVALRQWAPQLTTVALLHPHLHAANSLVQESALSVLQQLPVQHPAVFEQFLALFPSITQLPVMNAQAQTQPSGISSRDRVLMLKATALFAETPENVLATIVPIMKEVTFQSDEKIFVKGTLGTSLFIVCEGEVGIWDGTHQLTTFHKGDFFGELSLLDAESRSATAVALSPVMAFRIDQEDFYDVMEECTEVARNIMRVLCQRLRRQNEKSQLIEQVHT
ncbi:cyclic nucleotide-binding domain-containing protein [Hymenobacter sp. BT683]|uniref:Cyclic nucleotide-binding domain-containing protein n=1 Tax=Hymenobacter jeongseonensis TaxID=2791027 RepID=A0ABS0II53_9BACT|nr:cyclic nucleotide-binding domain-containing protein [Hymenobacter jeongseonensis]MBF9238030.1 cyclic nucleotide-binding domain-containing protein [Hymenobacter jeongseonensis]